MVEYSGLSNEEPERLKMSGKRTDYISWDEYFMGVAVLSAQRSKDPSTQVGACIVSRSNKIVGVGYNGFPSGCSDDELPWDREGAFLETKYPFVCHAELNAILNSIGTDLSGCRLYVALFPCNECAKAIIQSGIDEIIYLSDKYRDTDPVKASKLMLAQAGVRHRRLETRRASISISFANIPDREE
jgi:dCMP deaminase